jgi:hypothetical protein
MGRNKLSLNSTMKKVKKPRTQSAGITIFLSRPNEEGHCEQYYAVIAYDKKGREIPSSVNCCYNSSYYAASDILSLAQVL